MQLVTDKKNSHLCENKLYCTEKSVKMRNGKRRSTRKWKYQKQRDGTISGRRSKLFSGKSDGSAYFQRSRKTKMDLSFCFILFYVLCLFNCEDENRGVWKEEETFGSETRNEEMCMLCFWDLSVHCMLTRCWLVIMSCLFKLEMGHHWIAMDR